MTPVQAEREQRAPDCGTKRGLGRTTGGRQPNCALIAALCRGWARRPLNLVKRAWHLGIPVHEGYGLTNRCSCCPLPHVGSRERWASLCPGLSVC